MKNRKMTKTAVVLAVACLAFGLYSGVVWAGEKYEEKFNKTESLAKDGKVILSNVSGKIEIQSWDQAQVKIDATKISDSSSLERAKENCASVNIEVTKSGNFVQISTIYPSHFLRNVNVSVNYVVWVPDKASVNIKSMSGVVAVTSIGGSLEGNLVSGSVTLSKIAGSVDFRTVNGKIEIQDVGADIDVKTVSGGISATRVKGSVDAETTSGSIVLKEISEAKSVRAKALNGRISYDGLLGAGSKFELETLSGGVDLTLPANASFELEAKTFSGHINSDFPITMSGNISPKELRGVVNNGGSTLRLKTFSGSIDIRKR
jgi:DUF4097 and DUF4098 domain-containing protein YvlB